MKIHWSSAGRHYLQVIAFCCVVAVLTTAIWPNKTYLVQVGYALSVPYNVVAVVGVWRSAARYKGPAGHAELARIATVIVMLLLSIT